MGCSQGDVWVASLSQEIISVASVFRVCHTRKWLNLLNRTGSQHAAQRGTPHTHTHTHTHTHILSLSLSLSHLLLNVSAPGCHPQGVFQIKGIPVQHANLGRHHTHNNEWNIKTGTSILKWRISWPLKKGLIGCPETSVSYFNYTLRTIAEERIPLSEHLFLSRKHEMR